MSHRRHWNRVLKRQPDLFAQPPVATSTPDWSSLPDGIQQTVTTLMTRLLMAHTVGTVSVSEDDADEH